MCALSAWLDRDLRVEKCAHFLNSVEVLIKFHPRNFKRLKTWLKASCLKVESDHSVEVHLSSTLLITGHCDVVREIQTITRKFKIIRIFYQA